MGGGDGLHLHVLAEQSAQVDEPVRQLALGARRRAARLEREVDLRVDLVRRAQRCTNKASGEAAFATTNSTMKQHKASGQEESFLMQKDASTSTLRLFCER